MSYDTYNDLNSLEEFSFIAGTECVFTFNCFEDDRINPFDISDAGWFLCPYGQFDTITLQKTGNITATGVFTITLTTSDTAGLSGKYIQQPVVFDNDGYAYRLAQGTITISPKIV